MKLLMYISFVFLCFSSCKKPKESNIVVYSNYSEGVKMAVENTKNIFLVFDFYGSPTRSATKMLYDKDIQEALEEYIVIHLHVDGKSVNSQMNSKLQIEKFGVNYQPCYYILTYDEKKIRGPLGYSTKEVVEKFIKNNEPI